MTDALHPPASILLSSPLVRLFHERSAHRAGPLAAGDEEECFTALGRRTGVWLTTEPLGGPTVISGEVQEHVLAPYDVSGEGDHRSFVVPADVCCDWTFE